ncbi:MAG: arsenate reductase (glutaredoxin) [Halarcobacter sp.]
MNNIIIWHNPRCSKSRNALNYLEEKGIKPQIIKYLDETPSFEELKEILKLLNMDAKELMRKGESIYKELNLKEVDDEDSLVKAMVENPKLIERPIIINGNKAVVARPLENIDTIL